MKSLSEIKSLFLFKVMLRSKVLVCSWKNIYSICFGSIRNFNLFILNHTKSLKNKNEGLKKSQRYLNLSLITLFLFSLVENFTIEKA